MGHRLVSRQALTCTGIACSLWTDLTFDDTSRNLYKLCFAKPPGFRRQTQISPRMYLPGSVCVSWTLKICSILIITYSLSEWSTCVSYTISCDSYTLLVKWWKMLALLTCRVATRQVPTQGAVTHQVTSGVAEVAHKSKSSLLHHNINVGFHCILNIITT